MSIQVRILFHFAAQNMSVVLKSSQSFHGRMTCAYDVRMTRARTMRGYTLCMSTREDLHLVGVVDNDKRLHSCQSLQFVDIDTTLA